jgi:NADP-dependent aldehyde dehydrogenase
VTDTATIDLTLHGKHLIAGRWTGGERTFSSSPASGAAHDFAVGTPADVEAACRAAEEAFLTSAYSSRADRAAFLERIADEIEARGAEITAIGSQETGLPAARLEGERGRTTGQLRLCARHILAGDYLERRHDVALPDR